MASFINYIVFAKLFLSVMCTHTYELTRRYVSSQFDA